MKRDADYNDVILGDRSKATKKNFSWDITSFEIERG